MFFSESPIFLICLEKQLAHVVRRGWHRILRRSESGLTGEKYHNRVSEINSVSTRCPVLTIQHGVGCGGENFPDAWQPVAVFGLHQHRAQAQDFSFRIGPRRTWAGVRKKSSGQMDHRNVKILLRGLIEDS